MGALTPCDRQGLVSASLRVLGLILAGHGRFDLGSVLLDRRAHLLGAFLDSGSRGLGLALYGFARGSGATCNGLAGLFGIPFDDGCGILGVALDLGANLACILRPTIRAVPAISGYSSSQDSHASRPSGPSSG